MAYTVELYDPVLNQTFDITSRTLAININERLDSDVTTFELNCKDIELVHLFNHINIYKDSTLFQSGLIINQKDSDGGKMDFKLTTFDCEDWGHLLTKRIIADTYLSTDTEAGRPDLIIKDIISKYLTEFTSTNVKTTNISIENIKFDYINIKEAIENIFDLLDVDFHWYIDKNKDFHMFYRYESDGITFTQSNIISSTLKVDYTGQEHVNRVWIVGRKQASATSIDEYYTGDGTQRYFKLAYEPNDTEIRVNNVLKNSKLESNDDGGQDFLINKIEKVFYIPSNIVTPFTGTIKATYKPTKQFIDTFENPRDIAQFGVLEKVVKNNNITDKLEARRYGKAEVKKTSTALRKVSFQSRSANTLTIGQKCTVNISSAIWDVQGIFLIKSIKRNITPGDEVVNFELEELL